MNERMIIDTHGDFFYEHEVGEFVEYNIIFHAKKLGWSYDAGDYPISYRNYETELICIDLV